LNRPEGIKKQDLHGTIWSQSGKLFVMVLLNVSDLRISSRKTLAAGSSLSHSHKAHFGLTTAQAASAASYSPTYKMVNCS